MSDSGDSQTKYKWSPESTSLLISVWSDRQVQKQLEYATKPQVIWESVARYMRKKGYDVSSKQCRSRMKQVLVCYREAKRAGTRSGVEQYYETIDRVLKNKRLDNIDVNGIDTVDATNVKSPPKEVKTSKNLQMRHKIQDPVQSLYRTEALSPTWTIGRDSDCPDSPESNETIIARPNRMFSPTRDVAINTGEHRTGAVRLGNRKTGPMEEAIRDDYQQNLLSHYPYGEIPYQNTVQNVQNQIIQENMQQNQNQNQNFQQNHQWSQSQHQSMPVSNIGYQQNLHNFNQRQGVHQYSNEPVQGCVMMTHNLNMENVMRQQNAVPQNIMVNNRAVPQEPRKVVFGQNLAATYKRSRDMPPNWVQRNDIKQNGFQSPNYSPDVTQNLNDAFCESSKGEMKAHNLNETFNQPGPIDHPVMYANNDATVLTNNATCNDDSILLDFMIESPTPSEPECKKDTAVNTDLMPNAPFRKKKAQKLEQLVLSAISSQNEVVNKILAAQNDMVARFLDVDRDRQHRLENRLDHLLNVVHATVLNKNQESESDSTPTPEPAITALVPPPKPGVVPPKLDLVPPKPCRVPCTMPSSNIELVNQNPVMTRPGVVSPITSPHKKPGTIWSKLGPVSQSPFVKAQQRLGMLQRMNNQEVRTQSSAERRIAQDLGKVTMNARTLIYESTKFLEMERLLEEAVENARLEQNLGQSLTARRKLFTQREPTAAIILTAAFLDAECRDSEGYKEYKGLSGRPTNSENRYSSLHANRDRLRESREDDLLAGQGEGYDRLRGLNVPGALNSEPCDTSTPAKPMAGLNKVGEPYAGVPKQTIQQLAQLVMNSARWRDANILNQQQRLLNTNREPDEGPRTEFNSTYTAPKTNVPPPQSLPEQEDVCESPIKQYVKNPSTGPPKPQMPAVYDSSQQPPKPPRYPIGFTTTMLDNKWKEKDVKINVAPMDNVLADRKQNVRFMDEALLELQRMYIERSVEESRKKQENLPFMTGNGAMISAQTRDIIAAQNRDMIERYTRELMPRKQVKEKDTDSDNDEDYLDTTGSLHPPVIQRRGSLTSNGTTSTDTVHFPKLGKADSNCVIS